MCVYIELHMLVHTPTRIRPSVHARLIDSLLRSTYTFLEHLTVFAYFRNLWFNARVSVAYACAANQARQSTLATSLTRSLSLTIISPSFRSAHRRSCSTKGQPERDILALRTKRSPIDISISLASRSLSLSVCGLPHCTNAE